MAYKKRRYQKYLLALVFGVTLSSIPKTFFAREGEQPKAVKTGMASWYHDKFHGRKTASGDIFSQKKLTCASNHYPLGTWLKITNVKNGKSVLVLVNDRMNKRMKRVVDLSKAAAQQIGLISAGVGEVTVKSYGTKRPNS